MRHRARRTILTTIFFYRFYSCFVFSMGLLFVLVLLFRRDIGLQLSFSLRMYTGLPSYFGVMIIVVHQYISKLSILLKTEDPRYVSWISPKKAEKTVFFNFRCCFSFFSNWIYTVSFKVKWKNGIFRENNKWLFFSEFSTLVVIIVANIEDEACAGGE